jgi:hypothetical protein
VYTRDALVEKIAGREVAMMGTDDLEYFAYEQLVKFYHTLPDASLKRLAELYDVDPNLYYPDYNS